MTLNKANANQVNEKALQLLMQVAVSQFPVSAKTLSEQLNVPLSSLYRHLKLLKEWNLIEESVHDKTFVVGPAALLLMHSYETAQHGLDMVETILARLVQQTGGNGGIHGAIGLSSALCQTKRKYAGATMQLRPGSKSTPASWRLI